MNIKIFSNLCKIVCLPLVLVNFNLSAAVLEVGPQKAYAKPCQAIARAVAGDIILIDANESAVNYAGDVCYIGQNNLTLRGVNGRPKIDAAGKYYGGKGTWVIGGSNVIVDNIELSGSVVPDGNGAGIRYEGTNLTIRNSYFHHNQMGILTNAGTNTEILIENSEFHDNGSSVGPGHNIYIGKIKKFTLRHSYSHDALVGHLVKSRAQENHLLYNRLSATRAGNTSYEVDIPNAGTTYVIGNIIHQPASTGNSTLLSYGAEGATNTGKKIYIINNTFVNDRSAGVFINLATGTTGQIQNNIFGGAGTATSGPGTTGSTITYNYANLNPAWVDRANFNFRPTANAPYLNKGVNPGVSPTGVSLTPTMEYVHIAKAEGRAVNGALDIGAYEYRGSTSEDTTKPLVVITRPANNATFPRGGLIEYSVTATDNVQVKQVDFYVNGSLLCTDTTLPYTCYFRTSLTTPGTFQLQAKATDTANNSALSSLVTIKTI